jgi:arylsulfatase A-like enzyme
MPESASGGFSGREPRDALLLEAMITLRTKRASGPREIARPAIATVIAAVAAAMPLGCRSGERAPPNVLLITVDTLRADHLGSYGFAFDTSPSIDALAADGVVFEKAIAAAGKTTPAHASIMTSRYTREHSIGHGNGDSALSTEATLAEHFRDAGYATAAFVSNILLTRRVGLGRGFDLFDDELTTPEINRPHVVERLARDTTERALGWLRDTGERPFFLWVHYQDPHGPYTPPPSERDRFQLPAAPDEKELPVQRGNSARGGIPAYQVLPNLRRLSEYVSRYAGEIFYADRWIGEIIAAADAEVGRDTIVLLTADHGESFGENDHYFKHTHTTTPEVARVPLIIRAPGLAPERRSEIASHVDVLPTLLDLAGLPVPFDASGVSLAPLAGKPARRLERFVFCDNGGQLSAYRNDTFVWMTGVGSAWMDPEKRAARPGVPKWAVFRWTPGGGWARTADDAPLPADVDAYAADAVAMNPLRPPTEEEIERLRALGYAD